MNSHSRPAASAGRPKKGWPGAKGAWLGLSWLPSPSTWARTRWGWRRTRPRWGKLCPAPLLLCSGGASSGPSTYALQACFLHIEVHQAIGELGDIIYKKRVLST